MALRGLPIVNLFRESNRNRRRHWRHETENKSRFVRRHTSCSLSITAPFRAMLRDIESLQKLKNFAPSLAPCPTLCILRNFNVEKSSRHSQTPTGFCLAFSFSVLNANIVVQSRSFQLKRNNGSNTIANKNWIQIENTVQSSLNVASRSVL